MTAPAVARPVTVHYSDEDAAIIRRALDTLATHSFGEPGLRHAVERLTRQLVTASLEVTA